MMNIAHVMNLTSNGNGHGNGTGANRLLRQIKKKAATSPVTAAPGVKETQITFQTAEGVELHGAPLRVTRYAVVFELYDPGVAIRLSEALEDFKIILQGGVLYCGRAVIRSVLNAGVKLVCEAILDEANWTDLSP